MRILDEVVARLENANIPFALIGESAMALRGVPGSQLDTDLLARDPRVLDELFWKGLDVSDIRIGGAGDPLYGVVRLNDGGTDDVVDLVVLKASWADDVLRNATEESYGSVRLPVATTLDLILLKIFAGGFKDRNDIAMLLSLDDDDSLVREVDERIVELDEEAQALWREIKTALHL